MSNMKYYDIYNNKDLLTSQWLTEDEVRKHEKLGFLVCLNQTREKKPNNVATTNKPPQSSELIRKSDLMNNFCGYDLNKARKYDNETLEQRDLSYNTLMIYEIAMEIDDAPIVDAVEVVRCKDCKQYSCAKTNRKGYRICPASGMEIKPDDFCSYGERKEIDND